MNFNNISQNDLDPIIKYQQSQFYANYQQLLNLLSNITSNLIENLNKKYYYEFIQLNNSKKKEISSFYCIQNIGYPVPEFYLNNMKQKIESIIEETNPFIDREINIKIIPIEYKMEKSNFIKKVDCYYIMANSKLKDKQLIMKK